jgi:putative Mg2+ transporter-C (MgtC) family protein
MIDIVKLLISVAIGLCIGKERKKVNKHGGQRTYALVALGSCLVGIMALKIAIFATVNPNVRYDIGRLCAYLFPAIGFLASGFVIQHNNKVDGLTSAATLWAIVPSGLCIGLGFYKIGLFASLLVYLILDIKYWNKNET